jgi:hypothetical protein
MKTIKFKTDNRVFMVSNFNPKELLHIEDEATWNILKKFGCVSQAPDEEIEDAYFPHYTILPNDLKIPFKVDVDTNPFTAFVMRILQSLGIGKKK